MTLKILTFKKDRSLTLICHDNQYLIKERGFYQKDFPLNSKKILLKQAMKLAKIEFYHSKTLYLK